MRGPNNTEAFKQGLLKNLILSLRACRSRSCTSSSSGAAVMSLHDRKRAIKSSADIAMATARGGGARWPRALLASSSPSIPPLLKREQRCNNHRHRWRRRTGRASNSHARTAALVSSREMARRLVRKRTKVLRRMVPGGELLDEVTLLREAMDYVAHLHAQVDVLRRISRAVR